MNKPDGLTIIEAEAVPSFIEALEIQKVPGVGKKTFSQLRQMGIHTLGDVNKFPQQMLLDRLGKFGLRLTALAAGRDRATVMPAAAPKSVSSERTLAVDTRDRQVLDKHLLQQSEEVARQLRKADLRARTIILKIKHADFSQHTRSKTIDRPTRSSESIYRHAVRLLEDYFCTQKIRLIGVGASGLTPVAAPVQMGLFEAGRETDGTWETVDRTVEMITRKFGPDAVRRGTLKES
jgi:DNA polymerase-4